ncbi:RNA polymerase sigma factor [Aquihabitans daechungensis]|uniref:RNA polymerase sigma factor n=1 Tax=Aquihabitans daechungensis TaxID=1052257 RepID=UPI003BA1F189
MTTTEPHPDLFADCADAASEARLLAAVRDGSTAAFGILYARYRSMAVVLAQRALAPAERPLAEDVAEVAFIRVLTALRNGKGPTDTLRAYLATTVRREAWRIQRRHRRQAEVADRWATAAARAADPDPDPLAERGGALGTHLLLGEAFHSLSDRWRRVLWLTEVEGRKPAEVAPMLGLSAGSVSALAYRARNGLVAAYLTAYRRVAADHECAVLSERLGRYVAAGFPTAGFADVTAHLAGCRSCREVSRGVDVLGSIGPVDSRIGLADLRLSAG